MSNSHECELSEALGQLLKIEIDYNVIIHIGEGSNFKEFHAHSGILRCRSEYFNKILSAKNVKKNDDGKYVIKLSNISSKAFDIILKYIYTNRINIANKTGTEILDIMIASDELNLKLAKLGEDFIIKNHHQLLQNDPVGILQIVYYCKPLVNLQEFCLEKICSEPQNLFNSDKFTKLSAPLLEIILKRDDLNLKEIKIWENLIKWGLAQEQVINRDVTKWNQDDINIFKRILYKFIPLIRFHEISSEDYINKVKPYKKILSKELKDDILKFHMVPGYKPTLNIYTQRKQRYSKCNIDSTIISQKHTTVFANWIGGNANAKYDFNLLYRASRDGNTAAAFHRNCDNKGATIFIAKVPNSVQIFGGYNPLCWDLSEGYKSTNDSFIFSFTDKNKLQTAEVGYCNNKNRYSVWCGQGYGPFFGYSRNVGYDLYLLHNVWYSNNPCSYPKIDGIPKGKFIVDDYEVFQVI